jgi:hypothetical protein
VERMIICRIMLILEEGLDDFWEGTLARSSPISLSFEYYSSFLYRTLSFYIC